MPESISQSAKLIEHFDPEYIKRAVSYARVILIEILCHLAKDNLNETTKDP